MIDKRSGPINSVLCTGWLQLVLRRESNKASRMCRSWHGRPKEEQRLPGEKSIANCKLQIQIASRPAHEETCHGLTFVNVQQVARAEHLERTCGIRSENERNRRWGDPAVIYTVNNTRRKPIASYHEPILTHNPRQQWIFEAWMSRHKPCVQTRGLQVLPRADRSIE